MKVVLVIIGSQGGLYALTGTVQLIWNLMSTKPRNRLRGRENRS